MVTTGLVAIALVLGSQGEAPREVKFRGALLAQADGPAVNAAEESELDRLVRTRPSLKPSTIVLVIGGGVALLGAVIAVGAMLGGGWGNVLVAILGAIIGGSGVVVAVVGGLMLIAAATARAEADGRIRDLEALQPPGAPAPAPPSAGWGALTPVLLARF